MDKPEGFSIVFYSVAGRENREFSIFSKSGEVTPYVRLVLNQNARVLAKYLFENELYELLVRLAYLKFDRCSRRYFINRLPIKFFLASIEHIALNDTSALCRRAALKKLSYETSSYVLSKSFETETDLKNRSLLVKKLAENYNSEISCWGANFRCWDLVLREAVLGSKGKSVNTALDLL